MAQNRQGRRIYEVGKDPGAGSHRDKYDTQAPKEPLALWRPISLTEQNIEAIHSVHERLQPLITDSGKAEFVDPSELRFKVLGGSAVGRAQYLTNTLSVSDFNQSLKSSLAKTANTATISNSTGVKGIRPTEFRPLYIHVGIDGVPLHEMRVAAATLNRSFQRHIIGRRPFASFEIATIENPSQDAHQVTDLLRGINFGSVALGPIQITDGYEPLY